MWLWNYGLVAGCNGNGWREIRSISPFSLPTFHHESIIFSSGPRMTCHVVNTTAWHLMGCKWCIEDKKLQNFIFTFKHSVSGAMNHILALVIGWHFVQVHGNTHRDSPTNHNRLITDNRKKFLDNFQPPHPLIESIANRCSLETQTHSRAHMPQAGPGYHGVGTIPG